MASMSAASETAAALAGSGCSDVHNSEFYLMDLLASECWFVISLSLFFFGRIGERVRGESVSAKIHRSRTSRELWFLTGGTV